MTQMTQYIVMDAAAAMPQSCWGRYRRCAVVEVAMGVVPKMISSRARGVISIVATWERCHVGRTDRGAFQKAMREAHALASRLNKRMQRNARRRERRAQRMVTCGQ